MADLCVLVSNFKSAWRLDFAKQARFMGAISNNSRKLANFAGFYKGIQSAGAAVIWRLDGMKTPYMNLFASCWILLAGSLVIALPVILRKIKDTVPVEEDLKFTDETIEDVIGHKVIYDREGLSDFLLNADDLSQTRR